MEFKKIDLYILMLLWEGKDFTLKEFSYSLMTDKSIISKSLKRLLKANFLLVDNNRPKKYYLNNLNNKKWKRNN